MLGAAFWQRRGDAQHKGTVGAVATRKRAASHSETPTAKSASEKGRAPTPTSTSHHTLDMDMDTCTTSGHPHTLNSTIHIDVFFSSIWHQHRACSVDSVLVSVTLHAVSCSVRRQVRSARRGRHRRTDHGGAARCGAEGHVRTVARRVSSGSCRLGCAQARGRVTRAGALVAASALACRCAFASHACARRTWCVAVCAWSSCGRAQHRLQNL